MGRIRKAEKVCSKFLVCSKLTKCAVCSNIKKSAESWQSGIKSEIIKKVLASVKSWKSTLKG